MRRFFPRNETTIARRNLFLLVLFMIGFPLASVPAASVWQASPIHNSFQSSTISPPITQAVQSGSHIVKPASSGGTCISFLKDCSSPWKMGSINATNYGLNNMVAYQYGNPCSGNISLTGGLGCMSFPTPLNGAISSPTISVSSSDPEAALDALATAGVVDKNGIWFNNTIGIDFAGAQRAGGAQSLSIPTYYGREGIITGIYGGYGPITNPDTYYNISQSATLYYGTQPQSSTIGSPNVITGVSFYAKALDGDNSKMQATVSCSGAGYTNAILGGGGNESAILSVNTGLMTRTNGTSIGTLAGLVSIHFSHYLWCGDVNATSTGQIRLTLSILPWTILGSNGVPLQVGSGTSGTVSWSRVALGQQSQDTLSGGVSGQVPTGSIPEEVQPLETQPCTVSLLSTVCFASMDTQLLWPSIPTGTYSLSTFSNSSLSSGYNSNYGFTLQSPAQIEDTSTNNGACPPSGIGNFANGGCMVNHWNGYEYGFLYWPALSAGVGCGQFVNTAPGSTWTVAPQPYKSSTTLAVYSTPAYSNVLVGSGPYTCGVNQPVGLFSPSVVAGSYLGSDDPANSAFVVPTTLFGYIGTRAPVDGEIAMPSSVHLTHSQLSTLANRSVINMTWWESWQDPLLQALSPVPNCNSGACGQPLFWQIPIKVGNTSVATMNNKAGSVYSSWNQNGFVTSPNLNVTGGCPDGTFTGTLPQKWLTYQPVSGPNFPMGIDASGNYAWSGDISNVSAETCTPALFFNYTPQMPFPIGYNFYEYNTPTTGDAIYSEGQTIFADDYIFNVSIPGYSIRESFGVPGLAGILLPYPFTSFQSLYQTNANTYKSWWWNATSGEEQQCPSQITEGFLPPTENTYTPSTLPPSTNTSSPGLYGACANSAANYIIGNAGGPALGDLGFSPSELVSMTPVYGTTISVQKGHTVFNGGDPRSSQIFNATSIPNPVDFTAHLPEEQVGGYAYQSGRITPGGFTFNLSKTAPANYPYIQEFTLEAYPQYGAQNLNSATSVNCRSGGLINVTTQTSGMLACTPSHVNSTYYPMPIPGWGPNVAAPLNLTLNLSSSVIGGYPVTGNDGLPGNYVSVGNWTVATSLREKNFVGSGIFNGSCGGSGGQEVWTGPYPNLHPDQDNYHFISDPTWWSSNDGTGACGATGLDPYWAYSSNLAAGLLPFGAYNFTANATGFIGDLYGVNISSPSYWNDSLLLCGNQWASQTNSGCDTSKYNVFLFNFDVSNVSGPKNSPLTGSFITVMTNGVGDPSLTVSMNVTGCGPNGGLFCNNVLMILTPKHSTYTISFTDQFPTSLFGGTVAKYNPQGPTTHNYTLYPITGNATVSRSVDYFWNPTFSSCALSGMCGCQFNCGPGGLLGWLEQNLLNIIYTLIAALTVAGIAFYLHRKGDDQMAALEVSGGSFLVASVGWLSMVANWNTSDSIFLALLITGASIIAPGIGLLLVTRSANGGSPPIGRPLQRAGKKPRKLFRNLRRSLKRRSRRRSR